MTHFFGFLGKRCLQLCLLLAIVFGEMGTAIAESAAEPSPQASETFSRQAYLEDFDELVARLLDRHPQPFAFISEAQFQQQVETTRQSISAQTSQHDFIWMLSATIASVGCGHTSLGYFNQEDRLLPDSLRFPIDAKFIDGKLYVIDPLVNAETVAPGDEIRSINGIAATEIRTRIHRHISADANIATAKDIMLNVYLNAYVAYELNTPATYTIVTQSHAAPRQLQPLTSYQYKPLISPDAPCQENLCFQPLKTDHTALLTIRSSAYYGDQFATFKAFIDQAFARLADEQNEFLVIDLRGNTGGSGVANAYLLQHMSSQPFAFYAEDSAGYDVLKRPQPPAPNRFKGRIFVLADGAGQSSTGHFLSLAKSLQLATIIGEESGATYTVNDNSERFTASNTGIQYKIARTTFYTTAQGLPSDRGVMPDHHVTATITDTLQGVDTALQFTVKRIADAQQSAQER